LKPISAGVLITNGRTFLACHSTGNRFYDLPKGAPEPGESPEEACRREALEETGIALPRGVLKDLGVLSYIKNKDLHLFLWRTDDLPPTEHMSCTTYFMHPKRNVSLPEVDGYRYLGFPEAKTFMTGAMAAVIERVAQAESYI